MAPRDVSPRGTTARRMRLSVMAIAAALSLPASAMQIRVAGPRYAAPLYERWFAAYRVAHPDAALSFAATDAPVGALVAGTADLAATDVPPTEEQTSWLAAIPTGVAAVAVAYNLLVAGDLRLSPSVVSAIFAGRIPRWNDALIAADNPGVALPDLPIRPFLQRPDAPASKTFAAFLGSARAGEAPAAPGASLATDGAVADAIAATDGAIGYVDAANARRRGLYLASIQNPAGLFVQPAAHSVSRAAVGVRIPPDFRVSLVGARGADSYPLATLTYAVVKIDEADPARAAAVRDFLRWAIHDGQPLLAPLGYARLPGFLVLSVDQRVSSLK